MPKRKDATAISLQKTMTLRYKGKPGRRKNELIQFNDFEMVKGGKEKFIVVNAKNKYVETVVSRVGEIASEKVYLLAVQYTLGKRRGCVHPCKI